MANNADILAKYGLNENGRKQTTSATSSTTSSTASSPAPISSAAQSSDADILAKYGLNADGRRQGSSAAAAPAAGSSAAPLTSRETERADELDKQMVPSASRQAANAAAAPAAGRTVDAWQMLTPSQLDRMKAENEKRNALAVERANEADKMLTPSASRQAAQSAKTIGPVTDRASDRIALGQKTDDTLGQMGTSIVSDFLSSAANLGGTLLHLGNRLNYSASSEKRQIENAKKAIETYTKNRDAATTEEDRAYWQRLIDHNEHEIKVKQELADFKGAPTLQGAQKLYETSDTLHEQAQQAAAAAKEGKGTIGKAAVDAGLMLGNIGAQVGMNALLPGSGTVMRTVDTAGRATREYRQGVQEEDEYSPVKAALRGATAAGSVLLGSAMSKAVGQTGENILRSQGMDGEILPRIGVGAASGLGFAMGEIPLTEIGAALTDEHYSLEDREIGKRVASAVAFGMFDQLLKGLVQKSKASEYTVSEPQRKMKWFSEDMSPEEAAKLRRSLSRQYHPDVGGDASVMQEINDEYSYFLQNVAGRASKAYAEAANAKAAGDAATYNAASTQYREAVGFLQDAVKDGAITGDPVYAVNILASVADSGIPSAVTTTAQPNASTIAPASIGAVGAQKPASSETVGMRLPTAEEKYGITGQTSAPANPTPALIPTAQAQEAGGTLPGASGAGNSVPAAPVATEPQKTASNEAAGMRLPTAEEKYGVPGQNSAPTNPAPVPVINPPAQAQGAGDALSGATGAGNPTPAAPGALETQNTAPTGESSAINTTPAGHTPEQQQTINDFVTSTNPDLREMFDRVNANGGKVFERKDLVPVSERQAADAARILGGNYEGYKNAINSNGAQHIINEHGPEGKVDHSLANLDDAARLEYVLLNYDSVQPVVYASGDLDTSAEFRDANNRPVPMLKYAKKVDGTFYVVEAIPDSKYKKFWVVGAYMEGADSVTQAPNAQSPGNTSKTSLASPISAPNKGMVAQPAQTVNPGSAYNNGRLPTAEEKYGAQTPATDARPLPTAEEIYGTSGDADTAGYMDALAASEPAQAPTPKPKGNRPSISKANLRSDLISTFSVPEGSRATFASKINSIADEMLREGRISDENRAKMIRALYDAGVTVQEADPSYQFARETLKDRRIYVNEEIRGDLGDEWNDLRRRAMANRFHLVTDPSKGVGVDVVATELADVLGYNMISADADGATQLRQMIEAAELGKNQTISLAKEAEMLSRQYGVDIREEQISNLERQFDDSMRRFAEKAQLEVSLKDRADARVAKEKEVWREVFRRRDDAKKQREAAAQTLNNLKRLRKRIGQNDTRLSAAMNMLTPEEQRLAEDALANIATNAQRLTERAKIAMAENAERYERLVANDPNYIPDKKTLTMLERMDQKYLADLTTSELQDVHRALQTLERHLSDMNREIGKERGEEIAVLYNNAKAEIQGSKGRKKGAGRVSRFLNEEQLTPMNYLEMLGGWDPNNTWSKTVTRQLEDGERSRKAFIVEANNMMKDWKEKNARWIAKSDGQGRGATWYEIKVPELVAYDEYDHSPIFDSEVTVHLTPAMRVELARGIRNSDNLRHAEGGVTFPDKELYSKGKRKEAYARGTTVKLAPQTMKSLFAYENLTPEEQQLYDLMDTFFDGAAKNAINETSQILDGVDRAMSNHYSKIYTNANYRVTDATKIDESIGGMGSLQKRVFSRNPMLAMSVWEAFDDTVDTVAKYSGLAIPVRNVNMLFNWTESGGGESMKNVIAQKWGGESVKYIEDLMRDLQNRTYSENSVFDELTGKLLNNYVTATFGFNPGIVLKQFSSFPSAAAVLGVDTIPSPAQIAKTDPELIRKYTPELEYRSMGYASPELAELKNNPNWTQQNKVTRFVFGGAIQGMDRFTVKAMWPWAENYVKKTSPDLKVGSEEFYRRTAEVYNDAVSLTQPMYDVMHRAKIMQNPSAVTRAFTMFKTVPFQQQNMIRKAIGEAANAKGGAKSTARKNLAKTIGSIVVANLLFEGIEFGNQLWKNGGKNYRGDDDELTAQSAGEEIVRSALTDMAGMFLGGDELTDLLDVISGKKNSYYSGLETPGLSQVQDVISAMESAGKSIKKVAADIADIEAHGGSIEEYVKANGGDFLGEVKDLAETMSIYFAGVPITNIEKYLLGTLRVVSPEAEQAYKTLWDTTTKRDLSGLTGEALQVRVADLIDNRVSNVSKSAKNELARLYESTGVEVIPSDVPSYFTVNGERTDLSAAQQQTYRTAYAKVLEDSLGKLLTGAEYRSLTDAQKSAAITSLYNYAKDVAKAKTVGTTMESSTEKVQTAKRMGLAPEKYFAVKAQLGDIDGENSDEKTQNKLKLLKSSKLTAAERSAAYFILSANDKEKELIDAAPHLSVGKVTDALIDIKIADKEGGTAATKAKAQALLDATLPEEEKRKIYRTMVTGKHEEVLDELSKSGVSFDLWLTFERDSAGVGSTKDANGKDVKGQTKRDKLLAMIDSYDLSVSQKNAMYFAAGYAQSTLKNAPWNSGKRTVQAVQPTSDFARWLNAQRVS